MERRLLSANVEKARKIIFDALENVQPSISLMLILIHFETTQPRASRRFDYLEPCVEKLIKLDADNIASSTEREELSLIYVEFLGICGDVISLKKAEDQHATLFLSRQSISKMKKKRSSFQRVNRFL